MAQIVETGGDLTTGALSFYNFLDGVANLVPPFFALASLVLGGFTAVQYYRMVNNDHHEHGHSALGLGVGFGFAALLGVSAVVTYALSSVWVW